MKILIADKIADEGIAVLEQQSPLTVHVETGLAEPALCERIRDCDAVIIRSATQITATVLKAAEKLRVIGRAGIGVDNIDVQSATEHGVVVLNTPDANATTTAELALAHMMSLSRHLPNADRSVRAGEWQRSRFMGAEIAGKTIGIVGFGTIGRIVASRGIGLGMQVLAFDPFVTQEVFADAGVTQMELDDLLAASDYVTLHCPMNDKTRGLINAQRIKTMKPGARLINCARGGLVDEAALLDALETGQIAGAALDVYEQEPPTDSPLLAQENVVFTPHLGASTHEAQVAVGVAIAKQVATFLNNGEAISAVNLPYIPAQALEKIRPYQILARRLGRLLSELASGPLKQVEVALCGQAAELEAHPVAIEVLVGLLEGQLSTTINGVNAGHLAKRQGIALVESRSEQTHDFLSLLNVRGEYGDSGQITLTGTLLGEKHPRLVQVDDFDVESVLEGTLLLTRHNDRPGVIGALGALLGQANINIARMEVGVSASLDQAMAIIGVSQPLNDELLEQVQAIDAVEQVCQIKL